MATSDEKFKSRLPKIFKMTKWCAKWGATIGGLIATIYISKQFYEIKIITSLIGILCIILLFISSNHERIRFLKFISKIFISIFILSITSLAFLITTATYYPMIGGRVAPGITKEKIMSLKYGIGKDEVVKMFGKPLADKHDDYFGNRIYYALSGVYRDGVDFYLYYAGNTIYHIIIEKNDEYIYKCSKNECPVIFNQKKFDDFISLSSK